MTLNVYLLLGPLCPGRRCTQQCLGTTALGGEVRGSLEVISQSAQLKQWTPGSVESPVSKDKVESNRRSCLMLTVDLCTYMHTCSTHTHTGREGEEGTERERDWDQAQARRSMVLPVAWPGLLSIAVIKTTPKGNLGRKRLTAPYILLSIPEKTQGRKL